MIYHNNVILVVKLFTVNNRTNYNTIIYPIKYITIVDYNVIPKIMDPDKILINKIYIKHTTNMNVYIILNENVVLKQKHIKLIKIVK